MSVGDSVAVQNREGNNPLRWDETGKEVERLENDQYLIKYDGSERVWLRTWGNLRKIEHCNRSCRWPDLVLEEQERQIEVPWEEAPVIIPGEMPAGRVEWPTQSDGDGLQEAGQGVGYKGESVGCEDLAKGSVEQEPRAQEQEKGMAVELVRRRNPRVRREKRERASSTTRGSGEPGDV